MRRLLIVAVSALVLLALGLGARVATRDEAQAPEPGGEPTFEYWIGEPTVTTFRCGEPPYKPCSTVGIESQTVTLEE
jgi:hypothetical protein